jgi:hypothetical protein
MKNQKLNRNTNNENQNQGLGQSVIFESVVPHPEPVVVGELLTEIEAIIKRHVVLSDSAATALAVWVLHTYVYELRDTVAYVAIESPEKRCGKTTLLSVLAAMANKALIASNVTVGALFRAIDTCHPTLFIDEADTFLAGSNTMRGIINSGNTWRTAFVLRLSRARAKVAHPSLSRRGRGSDGLVETHADARGSVGAETHPLPYGRGSDVGSVDLAAPNDPDSGLLRYSCWCPKVIAMIGKVPDTIGDRSIVVSMVRKLESETRAPLAELNADVIKAKCARFALDAGEKIAEYEKIRGEGLNDRAADTFDPLYVIARLAGEEWEQKLHAAAHGLLPNAYSKSPGTELLLDIHILFVATDGDRVFTRDLVATLREEPLGISSSTLKYPTIDEYQVSQLLRPYGIKPSTFRMGRQVSKGYYGEDIADAVMRYVPKAEIDARLQELEKRRKLKDEVKAEREAEEKANPTSGTC